jgi:hypothetical protein
MGLMRLMGVSFVGPSSAAEREAGRIAARPPSIIRPAHPPLGFPASFYPPDSGRFQLSYIRRAFFRKRDPDRMRVRIDSQRVRALWRLDIAQRFSAIDGLLQN